MTLIQGWVQAFLDAANSVAFTAFGVGTTWGEVAGFATGLLCVWLVARNHVLNWPVGVVSSGYYLLVFWTAGLFADSVLQLVYIALGLLGWWSWLHGGEQRTELPITRVTGYQWGVLVAAGTAGTLLMALVVRHATTSTVYWFDALTTVLSLLATWGQVRRKLESWWLWIAADLIYVPLYLSRDLALTAGLYLLFLGLCGYGLLAWWRLLAEQEKARSTRELVVERVA
ncbi:nicotinamide riboside transporter PnuC [Spongisporangium articulatum]|uniref:Nicotinamide riboside transporter PnuC n=1 Tax=Spongisporangium articulatum TaxID=3362603 RepID=A0ABW8AIH8_9ACTN